MSWGRVEYLGDKIWSIGGMRVEYLGDKIWSIGGMRGASRKQIPINMNQNEEEVRNWPLIIGAFSIFIGFIFIFAAEGSIAGGVMVLCGACVFAVGCIADL